MLCLRIVSAFSNFLLFTVISWLLVSHPSAKAESPGRSIQDATGATIQLPRHPSRIVTLAPSLGEIAAELLSGDLTRIVGVSEYTDFPAELAKVRSVGSYARFSVETVVALKPDLVLATAEGNSKGQVLQLRDLGIPLVVVSTGSLTQVQESIRLVGTALNREEKGREVADRLRQGIEAMRKRSQSRPKHRVFLQLGDQPLQTVGGPSFVSEMVRILGSENLYETSKTAYPRPALEDVVNKNPDVILVLAMGHDLEPFERMRKRWREYPKLRAVETERVILVHSDQLTRPTPRLLEGMTALERALYGKP
jgi:iron complex transport system substrate-binding protein